MPIVDADTPPKVFMIRPWQAAELALFKKKFKRECAKWNDHFWLVPPVGFSTLDVKLGTKTVRPNIYCHLYVDMAASPAGAHRSINVVNLDLADAKTRHGLKPRDLDSGAFRSDADQYDSLDVNTREQWSQDNTGKWHKARRYSTIVHEIGHALGLPHIGVTHKDPHCQVALVLDKLFPNATSLPGLYNGASNSSACYGDMAVRARGANVMGGGTSFDEANAAPWASRLALHTGTKATDWSVSLKKVPPKFI